jgi:hypothetical protein
VEPQSKGCRAWLSLLAGGSGRPGAGAAGKSRSLQASLVLEMGRSQFIDTGAGPAVFLL